MASGSGGNWGRSSGHGSGHSLPPRREQPDEYDSQSRYGRRDDAIERGQEKAWSEQRPRRVSKSEREASNAGVWTAALFVGITALLSVLWVACAGLVARVGEQPGLYEQLGIFLTGMLGGLGLLGTIRSAWLLAIAPRVRKESGSIRRNAMVLALLALPFLFWGVLAPQSSPLPPLVLRMSATAPLFLQAFVGMTLVRVGEGRHGTHWGAWSALLWVACAVVVVFLGNWMVTSLALAGLAAACTMAAGTGAWEHYENRIWGVGPAEAPAEKATQKRKSSSRR